MIDYPPNAGRPLEGYEEFHKELMTASYHNAAEGTGEMGAARDATARAAAVAVKHEWAFWQIRQAFDAVKPLVAFDELMQIIMRQLRALK